MKLTALLLTLSCALSIQSPAQISDSLKNDFNNRKLVVRDGRYTIGEKTYRFRKLKPEFEFSPKGLKLYLDARRNLRTGNVFSFVAVGGYIAAGAMAIKNYKSNETPIWITLGSAGALQVISIPFFNNARKKMREAIFVRNKDVLLLTK